jgi:hypothetical protein
MEYMPEDRSTLLEGVQDALLGITGVQNSQGVVLKMRSKIRGQVRGFSLIGWRGRKVGCGVVMQFAARLRGVTQPDSTGRFEAINLTGRP